jgi:hypothetical protein
MIFSLWQRTNSTWQLDSILEKIQMAPVLALVEDQLFLPRKNSLHRLQVQTGFSGLLRASESLFGGLKAGGIAFGAGLVSLAVSVRVL